MRKVPPIVMHIQTTGLRQHLPSVLRAFHFDCIERRIENMNLKTEQKIKIIDGIIHMLQHGEQAKFD